MQNLQVMERNILQDDLSENIELTDIGTFLALTSNNELNIFACRKFRKDFERQEAYRLITRNEMKFTSLVRPKDILFGTKVDFYKLINQARKYPVVKEYKFDSEEEMRQVLGNIPEQVIPLFIRDKEGGLQVKLTASQIEYKEGCCLAYLGEAIEVPDETVAEEATV